jgi:hypothetical protein
MLKVTGPTPLCPSCNIAVVQIRLGNGSMLRSCSHCDTRTWLTDGRSADLATVLAGVAESDGSRRARLAS